MLKLKYLPVALLLTASVSLACMSKGSKPVTKNQAKKFFTDKKRVPANSVPRFADGAANPSWETKLGNLLLDYSADQIVLSIPAVIHKSSFHPFGDGQSNAKMDFGTSWNESDFPVIGIQELKNGKFTRRYIFNPALKVTAYDEASVNNQWYKVTPKGWQDSFYFNYATSTLSEKDFLNAIPTKFRTFSSNRVAPNVGKVPKGYTSDNFKKLGEGFNTEAWYSNNIHGLYPNGNGGKTAVGGIITWGITEKNFGPFKNLYTCFEPRNLQNEKQLGVPTGAGWHHIGDPAETIFNNLETSAIPVATGRTHGLGKAAYGLTESITATWLKSDEVLVSEQGTFHWYLNPYENAVCTEIWVHNCVPNISNNWGFNCQ